MQLTHPVIEVIRSRSSRRKYERRPIDPEPRGAIERHIAELPGTPFGSAIRLKLVTATAEDRDELAGLTTYGFIRNAPGFVVGALEPGPLDLEDFGFAMECVVLLAADAGLGTCWLGGTFNRSGFAKRIAVTTDETVPAVLAIGHPTEKRGSLERLIRYSAKAARRRPFESLFFDGRFGEPLTKERAGRFAEPLEMVRLGPSASNRQPWRMVRDAGSDDFHLFVQRSKKYRRTASAIGAADLQRIDMGIAICHFQLTARSTGLNGRWRVETEPDVGPLPDQTDYIATWRT